MFDLIWDFYQQGKINDSQKTSDHAVSTAQLAKAEVSAVDRKIDRLMLISCAMWELMRERTDLTDVDLANKMWELMRERTDLTDVDLANKMREIDMRDGVEDGKVGIPAVTCSSCGRTISAKDEVCIYCAKDNAKKAKIIFR
jgi:hypothetical protein